MQNRGIDNRVIGYGHFAEVRKVKSGPNDSIPTVRGMCFSFTSNQLIDGFIRT